MLFFDGPVFCFPFSINERDFMVDKNLWYVGEGVSLLCGYLRAKELICYAHEKWGK